MSRPLTLKNLVRYVKTWPETESIQWYGEDGRRPTVKDDGPFSLDYYSYSLIGKLTDFMQIQEFSLRKLAVV